jgi:hypothetical protein
MSMFRITDAGSKAAYVMNGESVWMDPAKIRRA